MSALANVVSHDRDERDRRWQRVRAGMAENGIDLLIVLPEWENTDARYLAQESGAVLFPLDGDPWIVIGGEDSHLALRRQAWIEQRLSATATGSNRFSYGAAVADALRKLNLRPRRVGIAGLGASRYSHVRAMDGYVIYSTVAQILEALPETEVLNGAPLMASARYIKSEAEIDAVRAALRATEDAAAAIGEAFRVGNAQAEAYRAGLMAILQPGVGGVPTLPPAFGSLPVIAWCPGRWGEPRPRIVGVPGGTIDAGLCVGAEIIASVRGAAAQVAEPYLAGTVTAEQREIFDLNIAAFEAARRAMRPGVTWREVKEATLAVAVGTRWTVTFLLHNLMDGPTFIPGDRHDDWLDDKVEAGTTMMCKPHVFPEDQAEQVARSYDVTWGDMLVVRDGGAERLGSRPQRLIAYE